MLLEPLALLFISLLSSVKNNCGNFKKQALIWGQITGRDLVQVQPDKMIGPTQPPYEEELKPKSHTRSKPLANLNYNSASQRSVLKYKQYKNVQGFY